MKQGIDYIGVAVGVMLFNQKGEIFMAKRSMQAKNERGCWELPGGSVEFWERLLDAAKREMQEEFGVTIVIEDQFAAADHFIPEEKQHWVATTFLARLTPLQTPRILEPRKCDAIGWFFLDNLPSPLSIITKINLVQYKERSLLWKKKK